MTFATSVLNVKYSFSATPLRMTFISGIPEPEKCSTCDKIHWSLFKSSNAPILCGATKWTKPAEKRMRQTGSDIQAKNCVTGSLVRSRYSQTLALVHIEIPLSIMYDRTAMMKPSIAKNTQSSPILANEWRQIHEKARKIFPLRRAPRSSWKFPPLLLYIQRAALEPLKPFTLSRARSSFFRCLSSCLSLLASSLAYSPKSLV